MSWRWRYEDADGREVMLSSGMSSERFQTRSDAETWLGETWRELLESGVAQVRLLEDDREVYGPMRLDSGG